MGKCKLATRENAEKRIHGDQQSVVGSRSGDAKFFGELREIPQIRLGHSFTVLANRVDEIGYGHRARYHLKSMEK